MPNTSDQVMLEPHRDEFQPNVNALYRLVVPAAVTVRGAAAPRPMAAGSIVEVAGLPAAWLAPMNSEARYAKAHAILRAVKQNGWLPNATLVALSLGSEGALDHPEAAAFVEHWLKTTYPAKGALT